MKRSWVYVTVVAAAAMVVIPALVLGQDGKKAEPAPAGKCMTCHRSINPGLYHQWYDSEHAKHNVTCIDCHGANKGDPDAFEHEGALVATLVTPKDCGRCHEKEMREVDGSHHAKAGLILESQDAYLAHATGGEPVAVAGCENCHGTNVKVDDKAPNKLSAKSWPNSGIGRLNPDGSKGSCTSCHPRHAFSKVQARRPEACGKCHLGPDHPQKEIYEESKHGNAFFSHVDEMNLKADRWVAGQDYSAAPTCATCHMSATTVRGATHDVGQRLSWTLRPAESALQEDWEKKRNNMKEVCMSCHGPRFVEGHYAQMDGVINLYDQKFAKPAGQIMKMITDKGLLKNKASFANDIEWVYYELWHHEGRRARHGAAMMGPDYTWWHGLYEVSQHFYFKFIPAARAYNDPEVNAYIDKMFKEDPMHQWMSRPTEEIKADIRSGKMQQFYKDMYTPKRKPE